MGPDSPPRAFATSHAGLPLWAKHGLEFAGEVDVAFCAISRPSLVSQDAFCSNTMLCQTPTIPSSPNVPCGRGKQETSDDLYMVEDATDLHPHPSREHAWSSWRYWGSKAGKPWMSLPGRRTTVEERACRSVQNREDADIRRRLTATQERNSRIFMLMMFGSSAQPRTRLEVSCFGRQRRGQQARAGSN